MSNFPVYPAIMFMDDGQMGIMFPDLPGCIATGASIQDAVGNAGEALMDHLDYLHEQGAHVPEPSAKDKVSLPTSFGRTSFSVIMVSANIDYLSSMPPHW